MLGVCMGHIEGDQGKRFDTCDAHKGEAEIKLDPTNKSHIQLVKYKTKSGEIYSDDPEIERDLDITLNLNSKTHMLMENRKAVIEEIISQLSSTQKMGHGKRG